MNRLLFRSIAAASLLVGSAGITVSAQDRASSSDDASASAPSRHHHDRYSMDEWRNASPEERDVLKSLAELERVYMGQGRINDLHALLLDLKARTSDGTLTAVIDHQLERYANRPANADQRIATLTQQLNDNLAKLP